MAENFYKVVEIEGKGRGCVALQDIPIGTLILKEKPQLSVDISDDLPNRLLFKRVIEAFSSMNKNDQENYLTLHNKFSDQESLNAEMKSDYLEAKYEVERAMIASSQEDSDFDLDLGLNLKIICLFITNGFINGVVRIKTARFNHSCCSNAEMLLRDDEEDQEIEIRAVSRIKAGQGEYFTVQNIKKV